MSKLNSFITPLCTKPVKIKNKGFSRFYKKHIWLRELTSPLVYIDGKGVKTEVPTGFITDGGSIPKLLRMFKTPYAANMVERYVLHDFDYASHIFPRKVCDVRLWVSSKPVENKADRRVIYRTVRLFGSGPYKKRGRDRYDDQL